MPGASSLLSSLPLGLLMFGGTVFALLRRKWTRKGAARDFPSLGRELGLEYTAGRYAERVVRIDPDDQRLIKVRFRAAPRVDLRSYQHTAAAPFDMITVYAQDREFDRYFKTRYATQAIAQQILDARPLGRYVEPFQGAQARQIQSLTITSDGVVCRFDYLPAEALRELLPACVALADLIEPATGTAVSEPPVSEPPVSAPPPAESPAEHG